MDAVERYASDAREYVDWVRSEDGQPVWREALVSYCTAFENCLKAIAVAFSIADSRADAGLRSRVIIPSGDLTKARRKISEFWRKADDGEFPKVRNFFESCIRSRPCAKRYSGLAEEAGQLTGRFAVPLFK